MSSAKSPTTATSASSASRKVAFPIFNRLYNAQPVKVGTTVGKWIDGVAAGISVHLQGERDERAEIERHRKSLRGYRRELCRGSAQSRRGYPQSRRDRAPASRPGYGKDAGASIGDRFGAAALVELLRQADPTKIPGTLTVAFVVQQRTGARGLQRILSRFRQTK